MKDELNVSEIWIGEFFAVPVSELEFVYTRSSAPGGQHVNKTATAVQLRFDVQASTALPVPVKEKLRRLAGSRLTAGGMLLLESQEHRSQKRNREEVTRRFRQLLLAAALPTKKRRPTRPTLASREKRLRDKRRHSERKRQRRSPASED